MKPKEELLDLSRLIKERNEVDRKIREITGRPASIGALGEHIAASIFSIELAESKVTRSIDGWFRGGTLDGMSVNIKWYGKLEGLLDLCFSDPPDYYIVLSGPRSAAVNVVGPRPLLIHHVHLFNPIELNAQLGRVKKGVATSVRWELWQAAEVYPDSKNPLIALSSDQREALALFQ